MPASKINPPTVQAYRETEYLVDANPSFVLRVDGFSAPLARLQERHEVVHSAYITACNPFSRPLSLEENALRQRQLAGDLQALGLVYYEGRGVHPSGTWPPEPSFLVMGLDEDQARALGHRHGQNAVLCCEASAIPRLILLR